MTEPITAAGRDLFRAIGDKLPSNRALVDAILAIEAEAAARQVTELRAALRKEHGHTRPAKAHTWSPENGGHATEWYPTKDGCPTCALLSAGDKAEAPPQDFGEQIVAESHLGRRIAGGQ